MSTRHESYSKEFKEAIVTKLLNCGDRSRSEVCEEAGVNYSTVANWVASRVKVVGMSKKKSKNFSAEEKLKSVSETYSMSEEELGLYLRREGLHSHNLVEWRAEFISSLVVRKNASKKDERDVKIKSLEREVLRKDKALAEASALLILQKKVNLIWDKHDEEDS